MEIALAGLAAALVGAFAGAFANRALSRRRERLHTTLDLFRRYHGKAMLGARRRAWRFLRTEYRVGTRWQDFFADAGDPENVYEALAQVLYFWQLLMTLHEAGDLNDDLSRRLFGYQFEHWRDELEPLAQATRDDPANRNVDWLPIFDEGAMDWLLE